MRNVGVLQEAGVIDLTALPAPPAARRSRPATRCFLTAVKTARFSRLSENNFLGIVYKTLYHDDTTAGFGRNCRDACSAEPSGPASTRNSTRLKRSIVK